MIQSLIAQAISGALFEEFAVELLIAEAIFCQHLPRRPRFAARVALFILSMFLISLGWPFKANLAEMELGIRALCVGRYLCLFGISLLGIRFCFDCSFNDTLFYATGAYAMQHFSFCCGQLLRQAFHGSAFTAANYWVTVLLSCAVSYLGIYFIFTRRIQREKMLADKSIYLPSLVVLLFTASVNLVRMDDAFCNIYGMVICALTCWILAGFFKYSVVTQELERISQLMAMKEEQYAISKDSIEAINQKCHDLKHQIARIRRNASKGDIDPYLLEIEQSVLLYDSIADTGLEALNIVLMDKKMYCDRHGVSLNFMADGEKLRFMRETDLYTLFGNMIDNAIEGVLKLEKDERVINLIVRQVGQFISIHVDNPFSGELVFRDGLPVSTKPDQQLHGYGVKSIRMIAERYDGDISISTAEGLFNLNVLIPVSE